MPKGKGKGEGSRKKGKRRLLRSLTYKESEKNENGRLLMLRPPQPLSPLLRNLPRNRPLRLCLWAGRCCPTEGRQLIPCSCLLLLFLQRFLPPSSFLLGVPNTVLFSAKPLSLARLLLFGMYPHRFCRVALSTSPGEAFTPLNLLLNLFSLFIHFIRQFLPRGSPLPHALCRT